MRYMPVCGSKWVSALIRYFFLYCLICNEPDADCERLIEEFWGGGACNDGNCCNWDCASEVLPTFLDFKLSDMRTKD